jgi:hypothetical protein
MLIHSNVNFHSVAIKHDLKTHHNACSVDFPNMTGQNGVNLTHTSVWTIFYINVKIMPTY